MADLQELIEKLEKAAEPDRELDEAIARLAGWYIDDGGYGHHYEWFPPKGTQWLEPPSAGSHALGGYTSAPRFSESIDAALALVPEGWPIENLSWWPKVPREYEDQKTCAVTILEIGPDGFHSAGIDRRDRRFKAVGRNPAIALCIVALKARAALIGRE